MDAASLEELQLAGRVRPCDAPPEPSVRHVGQSVPNTSPEVVQVVVSPSSVIVCVLTCSCPIASTTSRLLGLVLLDLLLVLLLLPQFRRLSRLLISADGKNRDQYERMSSNNKELI